MNANQHQTYISAETDAQNDVNKIIWLVAGVALNLIGILIAYIYQPPPPATRFFDKSEEFRLFYTEAYKNKARSIQLTYSIIGCIVPFGFVIIGWIIMFIYTAGSFMFFSNFFSDFF